LILRNQAFNFVVRVIIGWLLIFFAKEITRYRMKNVLPVSQEKSIFSKQTSKIGKSVCSQNLRIAISQYDFAIVKKLLSEQPGLAILSILRGNYRLVDSLVKLS